MQKQRIVGLVAAFLFSGLVNSASAAPWQITTSVCPTPPSPLSGVQQNVDPETAAVAELGATAQLDIASAYAPQVNTPGASWCIRYEVANKGPDPISVLWWPLAGLDERPLLPNGSPEGTVGTVPPGQNPTVKNTELYAFRSQTVHTRAYQAGEMMSPRANPLRLVAAPEQADQPPAAPSGAVVVKMGDRSSLPEIGAEFTGSGADVGATSAVTRDGDNYRFTISIGRNSQDTVTSVFAPFALALEEAKSADQLRELTSKYRSIPCR